ncbi:hypothetical protein KFL_001610050 [Klebsormidium nitens]|uniref:Uncharacterized protein n=1 Tax=Klebsormidium nitens TaxID=105231 RepID=A0A1Y1HYP0_KLENI|nr:hypothetical protein KFL_001610050 [Klebsormidium nitens]|eukprot:GAQ83764.1 hypothetical protein KFL_001610050 [Klebsormidium nitens]
MIILRLSRQGEAKTLVSRVLTFATMRAETTGSKDFSTIRWGFSSTCTFDQLPRTPRALAAMIASCERLRRRRVSSELLEFLTSVERLNQFLSKTSPRLHLLYVKKRARPGHLLFERFSDTMAEHVANLGDALQSLMGSGSPAISPLTFAFHGTPPMNIPSILKDGMLPEMRACGRGGDWFATSPSTSVWYCQKHLLSESGRWNAVKMILFLLLPIPGKRREAEKGSAPEVTAGPFPEHLGPVSDDEMATMGLAVGCSYFAAVEVILDSPVEPQPNPDPEGIVERRLERPEDINEEKMSKTDTDERAGGRQEVSAESMKHFQSAGTWAVTGKGRKKTMQKRFTGGSDQAVRRETENGADGGLRTSAPPIFKGSPKLVVQWKAPDSKLWYQFEASVGQAILAAWAAGQETFRLEEPLPKLPARPHDEAEKTSALPDVVHRQEDAELSSPVLTFGTMRAGIEGSDECHTFRWGFSWFCTFDRLPSTPRALAEMIANCEQAKMRLLQSFRVIVNERARQGGALFERFLDAMAGHVADLGASQGSPVANAFVSRLSAASVDVSRISSLEVLRLGLSALSVTSALPRRSSCARNRAARGFAPEVALTDSSNRDLAATWHFESSGGAKWSATTRRAARSRAHVLVHQVLSELLEFLISNERIDCFLSETGSSVSRLAVNEHARPGGLLIERFVDAMEGHVADLGGLDYVMVRASKSPPPVKSGLRLNVSWRAPHSRQWQPYEDSVARAMLAAYASGRATFKVKEAVRRSPRVKGLQPARTTKRGQRKTKRARAEAKYSKPVSENRLLTFATMRDGSSSSKAFRAIRWGFSSTIIFDRLPSTAPALAAMIAECGAAKQRQEKRIDSFLQEVTEGPLLQPYNHSRGIDKVQLSRVAINKQAQPGGALYQGFRGAMSGHVAKLGAAFRTLMGAATPSIAPLTFAFHGTPPANIPSILKDGMLPEKRVLSGSDWFAMSPMTSTGYCRKGQPYDAAQAPQQHQRFRLILFLLLPVGLAVSPRYLGYQGVVVMNNVHYELPLCTVDFSYRVKGQS